MVLGQGLKGASMVNVNNDGYFEVVWPRSARQARLKALAPRLGTLEGKTVAQLWDYLYLGDKVLALLEEGLKTRFPSVRFVSWREFGSTHGTAESEVLASLPGRFRELGVDAAISAIGA